MTYEVVKKEIRKGVEHKEYNLFDTRTQANKYLKTVVKMENIQSIYFKLQFM